MSCVEEGEEETPDPLETGLVPCSRIPRGKDGVRTRRSRNPSESAPSKDYQRVKTFVGLITLRRTDGEKDSSGGGGHITEGNGLRPVCRTVRAVLCRV